MVVVAIVVIVVWWWTRASKGSEALSVVVNIVVVDVNIDIGGNQD